MFYSYMYVCFRLNREKGSSFFLLYIKLKSCDMRNFSKGSGYNLSPYHFPWSTTNGSKSGYCWLFCGQNKMSGIVIFNTRGVGFIKCYFSFGLYMYVYINN